MSNVETTKASSFFPAGKGRTNQAGKTNKAIPIQSNDVSRQEEINAKTSKDAKVEISDAIKDFSKIKRAVDASPEIDNSAKIASLKKRINEGSYKIDYDALADKILESEF